MHTLTSIPMCTCLVRYREYSHTQTRFYCDAASIEVVWATPPCCLPTCFPFFLSPVFTTHSSSSIYTIYESSDPKGEMLHSIDYFHLVFPHVRHSSALLLSLFIALFFVLLSPEHENWTASPLQPGCEVYEPLWSGSVDRFVHWICLRSHLPWSHWEQLPLRTALFWKRSDLQVFLCSHSAGCGNSSMSGDMYDAGYQSITNIDYSSVCIGTMRARYSHCKSMTWHQMDIRQLSFPDASFDVILEKATLDAILVEDKSQWQISHQTGCFVHQTLAEV